MCHLTAGLFAKIDFLLRPGPSEQVYEKAVRRHLKYGSTTCSYFATIHLEATKVLVDVIRGLGQRAHVGKVWDMNMRV